MISKDVKNSYFSGKSLDRDAYLEQPKGDLGSLKPGQPRRPFTSSVKLRDFSGLFNGRLERDGWAQSRLAPALFFFRPPALRPRGGVMVTHVDDVEGGVRPDYVEDASAESRAFGYAADRFKEFVFCGHDIKQRDARRIDVSMRNSSLKSKASKIGQVSREQLESLWCR